MRNFIENLAKAKPVKLSHSAGFTMSINNLHSFPNCLSLFDILCMHKMIICFGSKPERQY